MIKPKRPAVIDIDALMVKKSQPVAPTVEPPAAPEPVAQAKAPAGSFRTSVYFSRVVHDKLRAIAFEERKTITDLINEGLDHVLSKRNYPTTTELREQNKA